MALRVEVCKGGAAVLMLITSYFQVPAGTVPWGQTQRELIFLSHAVLWLLTAYRESTPALVWGAVPTFPHLLPQLPTTSTSHLHPSVPTSGLAASSAPRSPSLTQAHLLGKV